MGTMSTEPEGGPGVGRDLTGHLLVPASCVERYERLLEEHEDADAVRVSAEVKAGREQVFTHEDVWRDEG
ncbi:hypothetical protein DFP74_1569 [Nocardiopsis sp. Huas11]|nr:hypothetical protein DFP74_1569 [Nocardiopsis sp. Huas11]